jgi:hypothetical protein
MNDNDDIDEVLEEQASVGEFIGELFLSTDGKNTVHVKSATAEGRKAGLKWAKLVYDGMRSAYGTKQQLNMETYDTKEDLGVCGKCGAKNLRSLKGKIYCSARCWLPKT